MHCHHRILSTSTDSVATAVWYEVHLEVSGTGRYQVPQLWREAKDLNTWYYSQRLDYQNDHTAFQHFDINWKGGFLP